jgi:hypothetical protein
MKIGDIVRVGEREIPMPNLTPKEPLRSLRPPHLLRRASLNHVSRSGCGERSHRRAKVLTLRTSQRTPFLESWTS